MFAFLAALISAILVIRSICFNVPNSSSARNVEASMITVTFFRASGKVSGKRRSSYPSCTYGVRTNQPFGSTSRTPLLTGSPLVKALKAI